MVIQKRDKSLNWSNCTSSFLGITDPVEQEGYIRGFRGLTYKSTSVSSQASGSSHFSWLMPSLWWLLRICSCCRSHSQLALVFPPLPSPHPASPLFSQRCGGVPPHYCSELCAEPQCSLVLSSWEFLPTNLEHFLEAGRKYLWVTWSYVFLNSFLPYYY